MSNPAESGSFFRVVRDSSRLWSCSVAASRLGLYLVSSSSSRLGRGSLRLSVLILSVLASLLGSALGVFCDGSWLLAAFRGGLHAGRVGGARRGPLLLHNCSKEGGDAPELRGAEVRG